MGVLALLSIYIKEMFFSFLAMLGIDKSGGNYMQSVYIAMTVLCIATFLYQMVFKLNITKREIGMLFAFAFLLLAFMFIPRTFYRNPPEVYRGQLLTAFSSVLSAFLMGVLVKRGKYINEMSKVIPIFVLTNTISSTLIALGPTDQTSTGFISDASGFNYQDLSYFIAYTYALNVFYIKNQKKIEGKSIFKRTGWNTFFQCLIPVHLLTILLAGGRGGFVLICLLSIYYFVMDSANFKKNFKNFVIMVAAAFIAFTFVSSSNLEHSGFERIMNFLNGAGDENRVGLWEKAFASFLDSPIIGHGTGSVFSVLKWYTHNMFMDLLVEYGIIGITVIAVILVKLIKKLHSQVLESPCNHLIVVIFMSCITFLMFSGYYLSNPTIWFVIGYVFSNESNKRVLEKPNSKYVKTKKIGQKV